MKEFNCFIQIWKFSHAHTATSLSLATLAPTLLLAILSHSCSTLVPLAALARASRWFRAISLARTVVITGSSLFPSQRSIICVSFFLCLLFQFWFYWFIFCFFISFICFSLIDFLVGVDLDEFGVAFWEMVNVWWIYAFN